MRENIGKRVAAFMISLIIAIALIITASFAIEPAFDKYNGNTGATFTVNAATKVYYAKSSKKYHCTKRCRTLRRSKRIYSTTVKKAKRKGLKKCKVCY